MSKKFNYCYIITDLRNNKQYVGDRSCNCDPKKDKYSGSGVLLNKEKRKYPKENFNKEILEFFETKKEAFNAQEKYINLYKTHVSQGGYNISLKGGCGVKECHSEETKRKISNSEKGRIQSEETKRKISISMKNLPPRSKEWSDKISKANKGKGKPHHSEETKKKISKSLTGYKQGPRSKEWSDKISKANKGKQHTEETKRKLSEANKGKQHTEETKKKMSEAKKGKSSWNKGKTVSEETKKKMSEAKKGKLRKPFSEETKKKMSEAKLNKNLSKK